MARIARKTTAGRRRPRTGKPKEPAQALRKALLDLVAQGKWRNLSYAEIAESAGLGIAEALSIYSSKGAILAGIARSIDRSVLESLEKERLEGSAKDRLFDILMRRFDRLKPDRKAYAALARDLAWTPAEAIALACAMRRSVALMLEASGISASGIAGCVRIEGLGGAYALALRVFFDDESTDLSATMAELDKRLGQIERVCDLARRKTSK